MRERAGEWPPDCPRSLHGFCAVTLLRPQVVLSGAGVFTPTVTGPVQVGHPAIRTTYRLGRRGEVLFVFRFISIAEGNRKVMVSFCLSTLGFLLQDQVNETKKKATS